MEGASIGPANIDGLVEWSSSPGPIEAAVHLATSDMLVLAVMDLLHHPRMMVGLGDSGAHVGQIMDAGLPTFFLAHWVRDREEFTLEDGIRRITSAPHGCSASRSVA